MITQTPTNSNILVTGGAGYIGSHTCKLLFNNGYTPVVIDNLSTGHEWAVKWGPFVKGDISDQSLIKSVVDEYNIKAVIHFAAFAYVGESIENPMKYYNNNVLGTLKLIDAIVNSGVEYFVFSSSCAVYGIPKELPITEDCTTSPINPYGQTKLFTENLLKWYGISYNINWVALRYFNAAGADFDGEIGEVHKPETHLIPLAIFALLGKAPPLKIFGTDYLTKDGSAVRDYIYVNDLADAHVKSLHYLFNGGESNIFNIGNGNGYSVLEIIESIENVVRSTVPTINSDKRIGDPPILVASAEKACNILKWKPRIDNIDEIINSAWEWHRHNQ